VCVECDGPYMKGMDIAPAGCDRGFSPTLLGRIGDMREGISPLASAGLRRLATRIHPKN
jgi:hypothetical protein